MSHAMQDRFGKLICFAMAVMMLEIFGRQGAYPAGLIPSNAVPAFFTGVFEWFAALGIFAPVAAFIALFCLDGILSDRK